MIILGNGKLAASPELVIFSADGALPKDGPQVKAQAEFSFLGTRDNYEVLQVVVKNLLIDPTSRGQSISGLSFNLQGTTPDRATPISLTGSAQFVNVLNPKVVAGTNYSFLEGGAVQPTTRWYVVGDGSGITTLGKPPGQPGPAIPEQLIIGGPLEKGNRYASANGSIYNSSNPHLFKTATFLLEYALGTFNADTRVSDVVLLFGTDSTKFTAVNVGGNANLFVNDGGTGNDDVASVPEPSALALTAMGMLTPLAVAGVRRWRGRPGPGVEKAEQPA